MNLETFSNTSLWLPDPKKSLEEQLLKTLYAMAVFGEARGEKLLGMEAVAQVMTNRAKFPHVVFGSRPGKTYEENLRAVLLKPTQFSCFLSDDPNFHKLFAPLKYESTVIWMMCLSCAEAMMIAHEKDDSFTQNSDHYFDSSIQPPSWADPTKATVKIGRLNFYRIYLPRLSA